MNSKSTVSSPEVARYIQLAGRMESLVSAAEASIQCLHHAHTHTHTHAPQ